MQQKQLKGFFHSKMIYSEKEEKATGSMFMILSNSEQIQETTGQSFIENITTKSRKGEMAV